MKHSRISLVERAAEVYDFAAALRAPTSAPDAVPEQAPPVEPAKAPQPAPEGAVTRPGRSAVASVDRAALAGAGYIVPDAPVSGLAEEFRLIKRTLLAGVQQRISLPEEKRRSVLITSAQSGDGKSFCAINLALSLAGEREVKVLLVDGDFAKPEMLSILGIEGGPGLVDALADPDVDPEDFVVRTDVPGLSVMSAGAKANDVPELLASERTRAVLARLAAADGRRIILFDSSPALMASPAAVLAGCVGQALVVVRADSTTEADLRETIGLLAPCDHVGLILNAAGAAVTGRKYGSYEGYGDDG